MSNSQGHAGTVEGILTALGVHVLGRYGISVDPEAAASATALLTLVTSYVIKD